MKLTPNQMEIVIASFIENKQPLLITGPPGIGKTDVVKKAAKTANAEIIITHPCISSPEDFKGMPAVSEDGTQADFLPFGDLLKIMNATCKTVVFFDDIGQAEPAVQKALMQLLLAREINGKKVSDHVTFIAATNRKEDKAGVAGMLEPVKSRFCSIVEMTVDHKGWIDWAISANLPVEVIAFIKFRPQLLHDFKPSSDLVNSPCPRTVANLARVFSMNLPVDVQPAVFSGAVGSGLATEFLAFVPIMKRLPKIDNICIGNDTNPPKELDVMFAITVALARKVNESNLENVMNYICKMSSEFQVLFVKSAKKENPDLCDTRAMIKWESENANVTV